MLAAGLTYVQALPESDMDHEIDFDFSNEDDQDFIPFDISFDKENNDGDDPPDEY